MIHKKILVLVLCTLVLSPLDAGPSWVGRPRSAWEAIERHEQGEIITEVSLFAGDIPEEFWDIETIENLSIGHFSIEELPEDITKLKNLRTIGLYGAPKNFRLTDVIARIPKLKHLSLAEMDMDKFPMLVCQLENLESLSLRSFKTSKLPECIGQLVNLKKLSLNKNEITELPESIGQLMNLEKLDLKNNQLSTLPSSIVNLINLNDLNVRDNNFLFNKETIAKYPAWKNANGFASSPWKNYIPFWKGAIPDKFQFVEKSPTIPYVYIVTATSGLSVRNKPKLKTKKIGSMPYKLKIAVYEESSKTETIDGISAPWMRIKAVANGQYMEGWAWGGYLEKYKYEKDFPLQFQNMVNEAQSEMRNAKIILDTKRIQLFIKNGADINTQSNRLSEGWTLLNIVADVGNIQDFRFLLANGADFQIKNGYGMSVASSVVQREDIGFESQKAFLLALQDYGYDFKADAKGILRGAIYSSLGCDLTIEEMEERSSALLDFLKEKLSIERFSEILDDGDYRYFCAL